MYISPQEYAMRVGLPYYRIVAMCDSGLIPHIKSGRNRKIVPVQADAALEALAANIKPVGAKKKPRKKEKPCMSKAVPMVRNHGYLASLNALLPGAG